MTYFQDPATSGFVKNAVFKLLKSEGSTQTCIIKDSIFTRTGQVLFKDFNGDGIKDILIQNTSDVRSNWTFYLYLVYPVHNKLEKVVDFETVKNPEYLLQYDLILNYVNSGQNWSGFYRITGNRLKDFGIIIYDDNSGSGKFDKEVNQVIQSILKFKK